MVTARPPRVLVTAGPTQEPLDPVRFISNRSTGQMGYAVARAATDRGYAVTLISGPTALTPPPVHRYIPVHTARQMLAALRREFRRCDWLFMTAAVADFRPRTMRRAKLSSRRLPASFSLPFMRNPDLLASVTRAKGRRLVVGWALETGPLVAATRAKQRAKRLDLVVANRATRSGQPFGRQAVRVLLLDRAGRVTRLPSLSKEQLAGILLDKVETLWYRGATVGPIAACC